VIWLDFETRSRCDLKSRGVYNYAQDPSTEVLCMSYAVDDGEVATWLPGMPFPDLEGHRIMAHNAAFERLIFWYVLCPDIGVPEPPLGQFYCTAAQARANCLPGSLEDVGRAVSSKMKKDHRGAQLIRLLSIPRADGTFNEDPGLMAEFVAYCEQDVRAMREISKSMRPLSDTELADYHTNERINDRGVLVDLDLCHAAVQYAEAELQEIQAIVAEVTEGAITSVRSPKMRQWVQDRVGPEAIKLMWTGEKYSIDKSVRANLLALAEENPDEVPGHVADVIQCADDLWASSVAKFKRLAALADTEDDRVRGAFVFAGGSATGRAASYGAQIHNLTRKVAKDPAAVRQAMVRGHEIVPTFGPRVTDVLKGMLRPALIPAPGCVLVVADWSAIEGRVNPWLSNCPAGEAKLDVFRSGLDPYKVNAMATFGVAYEAVTGDQRQVGKVQELACFGAETQVLTDSGHKAIVDVTINDLLWDGESWVAHQGVISKGVRLTISVCGTQVTPDHLFLVKHELLDAKTVLTSKNILTQALETGSANLPYLGARSLKPAFAAFVWSMFSALVARNRIQSSYTTFSKARLHGAILALKSPLDTGARIGMPTLACALMMHYVADCLAAYLRRLHAARRQTINSGQGTGGAASPYIRIGLLTKQNFLRIWSVLKGTTARLMTWIESMLTKATRRGTFGLLLEAKTEAATNVLSMQCKSESTNLRPVFDILNSGPLNRFTILTDAGPLMVHNCGFLGGEGSFDTFGKVYGVRVDNIPKVIRIWRTANPWAMKHGQDLEAAYTRAMRHPGHEIAAGRVVYLFDGQHLWYALPSGRVLCYPFAKLEPDGVSYLKAAWKPAADATEWPRARLWRGLAVENVTQAVANDLLRHALRRLSNVVLHVHDEVVVECPEADAERVAAEVERVMCEAPEWAAGLPLAAEVKIMKRYGK